MALLMSLLWTGVVWFLGHGISGSFLLLYLLAGYIVIHFQKVQFDSVNLAARRT